MNYTILKQWATIDGSYYSATVNKANEDLALGEFHSLFKPLQNDMNVAWFRLSLVDEYGNQVVQPSYWRRKVEPVQPVEEQVTEE